MINAGKLVVIGMFDRKKEAGQICQIENMTFLTLCHVHFFIFKNGFEVRVWKWDLWHSGRNAWVLFCW